MISIVRTQGENTMLTLSIPTMRCGGCSGSVTKAVRGIDPQAQIQFDMPNKTATIETSADRELLTKTLEAAGYPVKVI